MSLRQRRKPLACSLARRHRLEISVLARNRALHYLANHPLTEDERAQLTEVVYGYTGPCDVVAAREGLAWFASATARAVSRRRFDHSRFSMTGQKEAPDRGVNRGGLSMKGATIGGSPNSILTWSRSVRLPDL